MQKLKSLHKFFTTRFEREKMVSIDNLLEVSVFWKKYSQRVLSLAFMKSPRRMKGKLGLAWGFITYLRHLSKKQGPTYVVKYLKAGQLAISRSIAGSPLTSMSQVEPDYIFPSLTKNGLPKYLRSEDRRRISGGHKDTQRFWLTLFSIYRILSVPAVLKTKTITDPFNGDPLYLKTAETWFRKNSGILSKRFLGRKEQLSVISWELIQKSSSTSLISWTGAVADVQLLINQFPDLIGEMLEYAKQTGLEQWISWFSKIGGVLSVDRWVNQSSRRAAFRIGDIHVNHRSSEEVPEAWPGRLSKKREPAGKVRVFAMVDWWTQMLLRPLHLFLFDFLKKLPNDGTFNQDAAVTRAVAKAKQYGCCYGYDLSAATDRLPVSLQVQILASIFEAVGFTAFSSDRAALTWSRLLVGRSYRMNIDTDVHHLVYSVGQPMGALSSWAMLAVTHHLIVQFSAREVGFLDGWYDKYEVLGDDIVIFDHLVAAKYLHTMQSLGVEVNVSKSVISPKGSTVEFAKRIVVDSHDVSSLSWKMIFSQDHFSGRVATALWYLRRHFEHPMRILSLATGAINGKPVSLGTSALALLTAISGRRGITLESLLMGLCDGKGRFLHGVSAIRPDRHDGIKVPTQMYVRKLKEFFKYQKPISMWFSDHWAREEAVESLETEVKKKLNREIGNLVLKLCDPSYVRQNLIRTCTKLWPRNEGHILLFRVIQGFVEAVIWQQCRNIMSDYQTSIEDMFTMKGMDGLFQPKYLKMKSLEKLLLDKQRIEGVVALLETHQKVVSQKVPIPNSLKIIKLIIKAAVGSPVPLLPIKGDMKLYTRSTILDPDSDFDQYLSEKKK